MMLQLWRQCKKMIALYHKRDIAMLKLGSALPIPASICLHKSTDAKFYPFTEADKDLLKEIREVLVCGLSIVYTRKSTVHENFIQKSTDMQITCWD